MSNLSAEEKRIIIEKGTELPYTGALLRETSPDTYACRQCGAVLYRSEDKFNANCGWPSFDDEINGAVTRTLDTGGRRTEITCSVCAGHLGHVFEGVMLTDKNLRHCVNSIPLTLFRTPSS